jgi:DNA polymerase III subunit delta
MEIKNMNEIKELIKNKKNGFPIAIWGVEKQKIKECINLLYGSVDIMPELNIITLENDRVNYDEVVNACESLPFISDRKLVHIKNPYFIKKAAKVEDEGEAATSTIDTHADADENPDNTAVGIGTGNKKNSSTKDGLIDYLSNYMNEIPSDTILVLSSDEEVNANNKIINRIKTNGYIFEFKQLKGNDLNNYVKECFKANGKKINASEIIYFVSATLNNFDMMEKEIEKLCAYTDADEDTITKAHIDEVVHKGIENNIFKMVDNIALKNVDAAISILNALLFQKEEPLKILAMIIRQYRIMYLMLIMQEQRKSLDEIKTNLKAKKINLMDFMINNYLKQISKFNANSLKKSLNLCYEADTSIKNSKLPSELIMEMLVVKLCS